MKKRTYSEIVVKGSVMSDIGYLSKMILKKYKDKVKIIGCVHDDLLFEVDKDLSIKLVHKYIMSSLMRKKDLLAKKLRILQRAFRDCADPHEGQCPPGAYPYKGDKECTEKDGCTDCWMEYRLKEAERELEYEEEVCNETKI